MKIRGNAHHVAEKYLQLARDAHTSGDPVAAENYLQHAEHYFRLIASAQAAQLQAQNGGRPPGEVDYDDDDEDDVLADRFASPSERVPPPAPLPPYVAQQPQYSPQPQFAPQPVAPAPQPYVGADRQPFVDGERPERPQQQDRNNFRNDRQQGRNPNRGDRPFNDRQEGMREGRGNDNRNREFRPYREPNIPRPEPQPMIEGPVPLPSFITAAPRLIPPIEENQPPMPAPLPVEAAPQPFQQPQPAPPAQTVQAPQPSPQPELELGEAAPNADAAPGEARFPRGRRRRLRSPYGFHAAGHPDEGQPPEVAPEETPASE